MDDLLRAFVHTHMRGLKRGRVSRALEDSSVYTAYTFFVPDTDMDTCARVLNMTSTWREVRCRLYRAPVNYERGGVAAVLDMRGNTLSIIVTACHRSSCC